MHRKVDELFRSAGFSNRTHVDKLSSLFAAPSRSGESSGASPQSGADLQSNNPEGVSQASSGQTSSSDSLASSLGGAASGLLGGGNILGGLLGGGLLGDLFSGLTSLFGGGSSQPAPLVQYSAPRSQDLELATQGSEVGDAVYNQFGTPQVAPVTEPALGGLQFLGSAAGQTSDSGSSGSASAGQSSPQITLNVQAMDSQSFLDRSQDIAQAVRQAMLNMHSINDVINDL